VVTNVLEEHITTTFWVEVKMEQNTTDLHGIQ
jgi:hypothetical protein